MPFNEFLKRFQMDANTILIVEDDFLNRRLVKKVLSANEYQVLEAKNAAEATVLLNRESLAFVILDINLGQEERDGISLGQEIKDKYHVPFIYLTAYDNTEMLSRAVDTSPYSYLTKPFKHTDLVAAIELGIRKFAQQTKRKPSLTLRDGEFNVEVPIEEICYIEADKNYLLYYTPQRVYKNRCTIKQVLEVLPLSTFVQTHRAYIVNKNKIDKFNIKNIVVNNDIIPISKTFLDDLNRLL